MQDGDYSGADLHAIGDLADDEGLGASFVRTLATLGSRADGDHGFTPDFSQPSAQQWLERGGELTEPAQAWLQTEDESAVAMRNEWGTKASENLADVLTVVFSGSIDPTLVSAFEAASQAEQLSALRLLLKVSRRAKR